MMKGEARNILKAGSATGKAGTRMKESRNTRWPVALCSLILVLGCQDNSIPESREPGQADTQSSAKSPPVTRAAGNLNDQDFEIVRFVLAEHDDSPSDRIYFLTPTPMNEWGDNGSWAELPRSFHESISQLHVKYRPAGEAYLKEGRVLEKGMNAEAWMRWITIKRWISENEVEVENGVWCCPLGGGAGTTTYEKVDGKWQFKSTGPGWVS